jgi:prepilin-type N-terminal cleavage/methylation domain-containing protein
MKSHSRGFTPTRTSGSKGFTLIELLVVIAIIGLLASIILASLNTARQKGRDARRIADLKEMANAMELANSGTLATTIGGCTAAGAKVNLCTFTNGTNLSSYGDPSVGSAGTACTTGSASACQYSIGAGTLATGNPTTQNYEICAYLESGAGTLTGGLVNVNSANSGNITQGCN